MSLAFAVYCTCIFCYPALTARINFDRAVSMALLKFLSRNRTICSSVIKYELYGGFYDNRRQHSIHLYIHVHSLMLVLVVNHCSYYSSYMYNRCRKFKTSLPVEHLLSSGAIIEELYYISPG